jgi:hypothetical protein
MTPTTIPTNNLSFPSTCTTQGSVPLHYTIVPQIVPLPFKGSNTCSLGSLRVAALGIPATKMESLCNYTQMYTQISSKICKTLWVLLRCGILMFPHGIFRTIASPLDIYQLMAQFLSTLTFRSRMCISST